MEQLQTVLQIVDPKLTLGEQIRADGRVQSLYHAYNTIVIKAGLRAGLERGELGVRLIDSIQSLSREQQELVCLRYRSAEQKRTARFNGNAPVETFNYGKGAFLLIVFLVALTAVVFSVLSIRQDLLPEQTKLMELVHWVGELFKLVMESA